MNMNNHSTILNMIEKAKEMTQENCHTEARMLFAELAGHKNAKLLENVHELHVERGDMSDSLSRLRHSLFLPVMKSLEIQFPDYIKAIKDAL